MTIMTEKPSWFSTILQLRGSVLPIVLPQILLFSVFGLLVVLLYKYQTPFRLQALGDLSNNVAFNLVLGLLLVFRTNSAYDRFWEGRRAWGELVVNIRNFARELQVSIPEPDNLAKQEKLLVLHLLSAFAIATKHHLREEPYEENLNQLLSLELREKLKQAKNQPLEIVLHLRSYLQQQVVMGRIDISQCMAFGDFLNNLMNALTACERIAKTPMPIAYTVYLKRLTLIYCLFLPFNLVEKQNWWTPLIVAIVSFILFGVETIGDTIENPFGTDPNDLPLDDICQMIVENVESMIHFTPEKSLI